MKIKEYMANNGHYVVHKMAEGDDFLALCGANQEIGFTLSSDDHAVTCYTCRLILHDKKTRGL